MVKSCAKRVRNKDWVTAGTILQMLSPHARKDVREEVGYGEAPAFNFNLPNTEKFFVTTNLL